MRNILSSEAKSFKNQPPQKAQDRIAIRCKQCHSILCKKIRTSAGWVLHFKRSSSELYTNWFVINCGRCGASFRISGTKGIEEWSPNPYYIG